MIIKEKRSCIGFLVVIMVVILSDLFGSNPVMLIQASGRVKIKIQNVFQYLIVVKGRHDAGTGKTF